jgi:mono/diheme cytochrome c family protein
MLMHFILRRVQHGEGCRLKVQAFQESGELSMIRQRMLIVGSCVLGACLAFSVAAAPKAQGKGDAAKGKEAFEQCTSCHNVDTDEKKMGPSLKGLFSHKTLASGKPVTEENVLGQINNGGNGMPAYGDILSSGDKANILAYLHSL